MRRTFSPGPGTLGGAGEQPRSLRSLWRILVFLRPYRLTIAGALVSLTVAAASVLAMGAGLRMLVDEGFSANNPAPLNFALLVLFGLVVLLAAATFGRFYLVSWLGERVVADIRRTVYAHVVRLSPAFFEVTKTGELLSRLTTDTTLLETVIGSQASMALRNVLLLIGGVVMLGITSPKLMGLTVLLVPVVVVPILILGRRVRRLSRATQDRVADVGAHVEETVSAVQTVQAFGQEGAETRRFSAHVESAFATALKRVRARAVLTALVILIVFGGIGTVLWVGGQDVISGRLTPGELTAFLFYAVVVAGAVGAISEVYGDIQRAAGAAERLLDLLATETQIRVPENPKPLPVPPRGAVTFEHVTFRYPSRPDRPALIDFSLDVAPGERVALVGPSGAGKSTVFQLLLRFQEPERGCIRLDGVDIREADPTEVRARLGVVPQEPVIFGADAWTNIRYGRPDATDEEVRAAADAAGATEFLDKLPEGFSSFLGERGVRLSGGQKQRIAIARAILRNPAVLLLDEATSALDAESEREVQAALEKLMAGRTTIVIAHRLATVLKADRIVVMDAGHVVGVGRHEELITQGGLYARLAELQFDTARAAERSGPTLVLAGGPRTGT